MHWLHGALSAGGEGLCPSVLGLAVDCTGCGQHRRASLPVVHRKAKLGEGGRPPSTPKRRRAFPFYFRPHTPRPNPPSHPPPSSCSHPVCAGWGRPGRLPDGPHHRHRPHPDAKIDGSTLGRTHVLLAPGAVGDVLGRRKLHLHRRQAAHHGQPGLRRGHDDVPVPRYVPASPPPRPFWGPGAMGPRAYSGHRLCTQNATAL